MPKDLMARRKRVRARGKGVEPIDRVEAYTASDACFFSSTSLPARHVFMLSS